MAVPLRQSVAVGAYILKQKLRRRARYPLVLMLEPLFRCNLECIGCGKIQYPEHILKMRLTPEQCWEAIDECGAPVVSIAGGEPLLHPEMAAIVEGYVRRRKFVYLCTNAIQLKRRMDDYRPGPYFSFSVHMDGLQEEHDHAVNRDGVYERAVEAIRMAKDRGFRVTTNTTLFNTADPERVRAFFDEMTELRVDGMMISPGYPYEKAPDQEHFLHRSETKDLFRRILRDIKPGWRFNQSPVFLDFLQGKYDFDCTPWGNPTRNVFGWQRPCYLMSEGYASSWDELINGTDWGRYGQASGNPKCVDCMVHSGYEASAVVATSNSPRLGAQALRELVFKR
ncbi:MAG: adenosyl-hopene transferase HpnH [Dehalococcoidia bacterium]|nr:adenosyl-hopene transferase HpnH [Dehalococcoidia bacterium]